MVFQLSLAAGYASVAIIRGLVASWALTTMAPERKRLRTIAGTPGATGLLVEDSRLTEKAPGSFGRIATTIVPKSPKDLSRLRRRLGRAGYRSMTAAVIYSLAEI